MFQGNLSIVLSILSWPKLLSFKQDPKTNQCFLCEKEKSSGKATLDEVTSEEQTSLAGNDIYQAVTKRYTLEKLKQMTFRYNMVYNGMNLKVGDFVYLKSDPENLIKIGKEIDGKEVDIGQIGCLFVNVRGTKKLAGMLYT